LNTLTNAYEKKLSSGLIASLLILSTLAFLAPAVLPAHATNSGATISLVYPYAEVNTLTSRVIKITNPLGNPGITSIAVNLPLASAQSIVSAGSPTASASAPSFVAGFTSFAGTPSGAGTGPWTIVYGLSASAPSGSVLLPAGAAGKINFVFTAEASESTTGVVDSYPITVTVTFADGSTASSALTLYEGSATTSVTVVTNGKTTFTAGTGIGITSTAETSGNVGDQGVPLKFFSSESAAVAAAGFTDSFSPASGTTGSAGTTTSSYMSTAADVSIGGTYALSADVGTPTPTYDTATLTVTPTTALTLIPGPPTQSKVTTAYDVSGDTPDYVNSPAAQDIGVTLADQYGNPVTTSASGTVTLSALQGTLSATTGTVTNGVLSTVITYAPTKSGVNLPYGTFDLISSSLVIPSGTLAGTYAGSSAQLSIGCLASNCGSPPTPTVTYYDPSGNPVAGSTIGLSITLTTQKGIPVNFTLATDASSAGTYTGTFANGKSWIVVDTNSQGVAAANFTADTTAGDSADAGATVNTPTTASPSHTNSATPTSGITTVAAAASQLQILTYSSSSLASSTATSYVGPSKHLYLDVTLQDKYGNTVPWNNAFSLQIGITASAGGLSSTTVYITNGMADTHSSGYTVQYTAPATLGSVTLTASTSQSGISSGTDTVHVVSLSPSVSLTPVAKTTLSSNTAIVNATGVPSLASPAGTVVTTFEYSLNGAANLTAGVTATNSSGASFAKFSVTFLNGTNTLKIYATDSNGNVGVGTFTFTVSHAPPSPTTFTSTGASSTKAAGFTGVSVTFTNTGAATSVNVYFVWYNSANQIVSVGAQLNVPFTAGGSGTFFSSFSTPGTYTVQVFVQSTSGNALSTSYSATVTIS
jgi:hypothetical protein